MPLPLDETCASLQREGYEKIKQSEHNVVYLSPRRDQELVLEIKPESSEVIGARIENIRSARLARG